jgi:hypothetical protein
MCASQVCASHHFGSEYVGSGHGVVEGVVGPLVAAVNAQENCAAQGHVPVASLRWRTWCITFLIPGRLSAIRIACMLLLITIVILPHFIQVLLLDLSMIFTTVALVTPVVAAVVPFRKKV